MAYDPTNPTDFEKFSTVLRSHSLNTLRKRLNGMFLDNDNLIDPDTGAPSSEMGATQTNIKNYITNTVEEYFNWYKTMDLTGTINCTSETVSTYANLNNGTIDIALINIPEEFILSNSLYAIKVYIPNLGTKTISTTDISKTISFTGVNSGTYNVYIYDDNEASQGVDRYRLYTSIFVPYNAAGNIYPL